MNKSTFIKLIYCAITGSINSLSTVISSVISYNMITEVTSITESPMSSTVILTGKAKECGATNYVNLEFTGTSVSLGYYSNKTLKSELKSVISKLSEFKKSYIGTMCAIRILADKYKLSDRINYSCNSRCIIAISNNGNINLSALDIMCLSSKGDVDIMKSVELLFKYVQLNCARKLSLGSARLLEYDNTLREVRFKGNVYLVSVCTLDNSKKILFKDPKLDDDSINCILSKLCI